MTAREARNKLAEIINESDDIRVAYAEDEEDEVQIHIRFFDDPTPTFVLRVERREKR